MSFFALLSKIFNTFWNNFCGAKNNYLYENPPVEVLWPTKIVQIAMNKFRNVASVILPEINTKTVKKRKSMKNSLENESERENL